MSRDKPCPECGEPTDERVRPLRATIGFILVVTGLLLFLMTLGASFVLSVYGVFMMAPQRRCTSCRWRE